MLTLKIIFEVLAVLALLYGYLNEDRVITWERRKARQIRRLVASWRHGKKVNHV